MIPDDEIEGASGGPELQTQDRGRGRSSARDTWIGIRGYFLWTILSGLFTLAISRAVSRELVRMFGGVMSLAYWGGLIAIWIIARRRGRPGIAKGLLIGFLISISLAVLLVASCFGLSWSVGSHLGQHR